MSKENQISNDENCSTGTCAPVSPFSRSGALFLLFLIVLLMILFLILYFNGYLG
ncbi:hypothetical protein [uncultured Methanobrevibacter sp.]|uniref:hypothetical protein n=1 Tax=uncultured Methanobrevibacter sp. TaxID=253161 RepID=UPI0026280046